MENKNHTRIEERETLGLAYITKEILQEGEELPFKIKNPYLPHYDRLQPIDWTKKVDQIYFKLSYSPNYPSFEDSQDLLLMRSADRSDSQDKYLPQIRLEDFGEGKDKLFLSFERERMYHDNPLGNPWFGERDMGEHDRRRLELLSGEQERFCKQIPGSGGLTSPKRFISTAMGALTFQKDFYDELRDVYIDQERIPFAGLRRLRVGWIEGNQFEDGYPEFNFVAYEFDGEKWGERIRDLKNGFHFRKDGKLKTLNVDAIVSHFGKDSNLTPKDLQLVRLPGYENRGIVFGRGKAYEIEMDSTNRRVKVSSLRELPFQNVVNISPISSQKINNSFLEWTSDPQSNPHRDLGNWISKAS